MNSGLPSGPPRANQHVGRGRVGAGQRRRRLGEDRVGRDAETGCVRQPRDDDLRRQVEVGRIHRPLPHDVGAQPGPVLVDVLVEPHLGALHAEACQVHQEGADGDRAGVGRAPRDEHGAERSDRSAAQNTRRDTLAHVLFAERRCVRDVGQLVRDAGYSSDNGELIRMRRAVM